VSIADVFTTTMPDDAGFVKRARAKLKLTQGQFAELLGLERRTVMRYERGDQLPPQTRFAIKWLVARDKRLKQRARERTIRFQR
jgi:transcriptional regulator with XRE-family HTH domain